MRAFPAASRSLRVAVGQAQVAYQVAGSGPPLVLIHGLSGSTRWWVHNVNVFAAHFTVYSIDLIGFGDSRGHPFVLCEAANYLVQWMELLGIDQPSIIAHSMGGLIAADLAAEHPEALNKLVLVDAATLPFDYGYMQHAVGLTRAINHLPLSFWPVLATDALRAGPITLFKAAHELLHTDIRRKLVRIKAPTLVIWGEHDTVVPLRLGKQIELFLPRSKLVVISRAGHNPMWDRPQVFNKLVLEFLQAAEEG